MNTKPWKPKFKIKKRNGNEKRNRTDIRFAKSRGQ